MNPELPRNPQEELEARLTALLLGELSAAEAAAVHRAIERDAELAKLFARLHHTIGLVRETAVTPAEPAMAPPAPLKLSEERRQKLLAQFKTLAPREFTPEKRSSKLRLIELAAVLVILGLLALAALPNFVKSRKTSQRNAIINNLRQIDSAKQQWALENNRTANDAPTFDDIKPYLRQREMPDVAGETYVLGKVGEPPAAEVAAVDAKQTFGRFSANLPRAGRGDRVRLSSDGGVSTVTFGTSQANTLNAEAEQLAFRTRGLERSEPAAIIRAPNPEANYFSRVPKEQPTPDASATLPPPQPRAQIILPAAEAASGYGANLEKVDQELGRSEQVGELEVAQTRVEALVIDPSTGLPVAPTLPGPHDGNNDAAFQYRYAFGVTEANGLSIEKLHEGLKNGSSPNLNRELFPGGEPVAVPIASGGMGGGGSGGGGGGGGPVGLSPITSTNAAAELNGAVPAYYAATGVNADKNQLAIKIDPEGRQMVVGTPPELSSIAAVNEGDAQLPSEASAGAKLAETAQAENKALGFGLNLGNATKGRNEGAGLGGPQPTRTVRTEPGLAAGATITAGGRVFTDSVEDGFAAGSLGSEAGRIAPASNVYSLDVVGYGNVSTKLADSAIVTVDESVRRQPNSIVLPGLATSTESRPSQIAPEEKQPASDSLEVAGKRSEAVLLAKAESADQRVKDSEARLQENRAYSEKKRELQDLTDLRRLLARKLAQEEVDLSLPKSAQVEIVEPAEAKSAPSQTVWGTIRGAVSGDVERAARIKVERDKSDIEELSGGRHASTYDPYFVQTEFETIQSEAVLGKVVSQLGLDKAWAKNEGAGGKLSTSDAVSLLRKRLDLHPVPNSTLVEIRAKADKPDEAARIANAVAENYQHWRMEQGRRLVASGLASLKESSKEQDEKIRRAQQELEVLGRSARVEADLPLRKPATNAPIPQPEVQTSENNFSTFSLNVSDVSFKLAAASLEKGQMPDVATVRSEEFINAFDYHDPEPLPGAPIAFAWERARYPFAVNRDLLRFSLKTAAAGRQAGRPLNIVLLLDNSGSMERADRVQIIREALRVLAAQLQPQDKLSVITFARTPRLVVDGISGDKAGEVAGQVGGLTPQGGTNLEEAMNLAYETAARHYLVNGINRVVVLTDGAANLGDVEPASLKQKVEAARQQGIALDCFGIGWEGFNDDLLEVLSRNGDGRYGFINSPEEAATDFVGQLAGALKVAASDVKVQVEFNPARVTSYRQIGYAKHQLTKEQFRDNTVDAAEIAAQEAGNALYTVEVNPDGSGPLGTIRVRYKIPGTTDYREQAWDVPYTGNALALDQSSPAMRLAASASAFAEWLVASPFAGEVSPDALLGYLRSVPEVFGADSRPKKLEWMIRQAKSIEGK